MKRLLSLLVLLYCISCGSNKETVKTKVKENTSYYEKSTIKVDSIIHIDKDTAALSLSFKDIKLFNQYLNLDSIAFKPSIYKTNGRAKIEVKFKRDSIQFFAECDSLNIRLQVIKELEKNYQQSIQSNKKSVEKKGYSLFQIILYCIACLAIGFVAGYITKHINKIIP